MVGKIVVNNPSRTIWQIPEISAMNMKKSLDTTWAYRYARRFRLPGIGHDEHRAQWLPTGHFLEAGFECQQRLSGRGALEA